MNDKLKPDVEASDNSPIRGSSQGEDKNHPTHEYGDYKDPKEKIEYQKPQIFSLWAVFTKTEKTANDSVQLSHENQVEEFDKIMADLEQSKDVYLRGIYDCSALRSDADIMLWLHGPDAQSLQEAFRHFRDSAVLKTLSNSFNAMGVHREAEFSKEHSPAFYRGVPPSNWVTMYPFVRSYDWYILPEEQRAQMLRDHGMLGREFPQVLANTVASFALGDYEWILSLEAPEVTDLVDMMRRLRYTEARLHVREEVPFYTGRRISSTEMVSVLR